MAKVKLDASVVHTLRDAAADTATISGWTHNFYRYPARFSPRFAAAAIECLSRPGELVLDPYMGGGTVVVEALASGRVAAGNDLNSLATFVAEVKTTALSHLEVRAVRQWSAETVARLSYRTPALITAPYVQSEKMKNLHLLRARFIKKVVAAAIASINADLPTENAQRFARCAVLRSGQWALDGRRKQTSLDEFRLHLAKGCAEMLDQLASFTAHVGRHGKDYLTRSRVLSNGDASHIPTTPYFAGQNKRASLVITSPPYPGVHVLYHRWQVDGRRESPAPYWIINGSDGQSASYYTFNDRRQTTSEPYFVTSLETLRAIREVMTPGGLMIQLIAFNDPAVQLPRYLQNMAIAGFDEVGRKPGKSAANGRFWRGVPNRKWHAANRGETASSKEVLLIHRAD